MLLAEVEPLCYHLPLEAWDQHQFAMKTATSGLVPEANGIGCCRILY